MNTLLRAIGNRLAAYLLAPRPHGAMVATVAPGLLEATLRPGDVLLVEGESRISMAIKILTQSNWSHAALYVGDALGRRQPNREPGLLIEADLREGVRAVALDKYTRMHTRICRPVGLSEAEVGQVIDYAARRIGYRYDMKNVLDLARYLIPTPPVPTRWKRRMIALGSGDPSRAICSTLIAETFQSLHYPILPDVTLEHAGDPTCKDCVREIMHVRHHSLYTPRDFDISPYFEVVKPALAHSFDYHRLVWADDAPFLPRG
jgi:hypothetical protein